MTQLLIVEQICELYLALDEKKIKISYVAFEPDKKAFSSLEKNTKNANKQLYNLALSDKNEKQNLYKDTDGGNTSLSEFESTTVEEIDTKTLDSFNLKNIKLLKIDAEGHEPEVLTGLTETLKNVEYIAIDHSGERGFNQEKTTVEVFDFLYKNNFQVVAVSPYREISLFKNSFQQY